MGLVVIISDWDCVWETGLVLLVHVVPCYLRNMRRCQCCVKAWRGYRCPSVPGTLSNCSVWQCTLLGVCGDLNCEGMWKLLQFNQLTQCRKPKKPCPQTTSPAWSLLAAPPPLQWANTAEDVSPLEEVTCIVTFGRSGTATKQPNLQVLMKYWTGSKGSYGTKVSSFIGVVDMVGIFTLNVRTQLSITLKLELQSEPNTYWKVSRGQIQTYILVDYFLLFQMDWKILES